ncbi:hypothetical protein Hbl1158_12885 [Halobaculum sp. CBA1158]|uniref:hypothetical protein n=1 Tax=Halobaculum sp. CBA1158 TaxID=2904243 RepID=UPI001F19E5DF|nr:hypothetical protein [Halobaculum sp. CBA1158]UIO99410.1 hypothetical protein Hbl1158_12885 [Halobaculum sp. CBA1158]
MDATLTAATVASSALLQLPGPLDTTLGKVFLALVAFLVVLTVGRVLLSFAWKLALLAAVGIGAFLLVTTFLL